MKTQAYKKIIKSIENGKYMYKYKIAYFKSILKFFMVDKKVSTKNLKLNYA